MLINNLNTQWLILGINRHFGLGLVGVWVWVLGLDPDPNRIKINLGLVSEFNSIHFGIEIIKSLKFLRHKKLKFVTNFWTLKL